MEVPPPPVVRPHHLTQTLGTPKSAKSSWFSLNPQELSLEFYHSSPWDYLDVARFGSFPTYLDISVFFLPKGVDGRITALAPPNEPSYSLLSDGIEEWTNDLV